ncbi:hypothetical protein TNCV_4939821 [Trichonephila clavipes]|nr:hypothetical protein TNCV_4939821 [Trichonephila clavipes]
MPNCRLRVLPPMRAWLRWWRATNCLPSCTFKILPFSLGEGSRLYRKGRGSCPAVPWMDFLVNEVSSTPRCEKSIQTPNLHFKPIEKSGHYFARPSSSPYIGWIHPSTWYIIVQPCVCFLSYRGSMKSIKSHFLLLSSLKAGPRVGFLVNQKPLPASL